MAILFQSSLRLACKSNSDSLSYSGFETAGSCSKAGSLPFRADNSHPSLGSSELPRAQIQLQQLRQDFLIARAGVPAVGGEDGFVQLPVG